MDIRLAAYRRLLAPVALATLLAGCGASATPSPTPPPDPTLLLTSAVAATSTTTGPIDLGVTLDGKILESGKTTDISGSSLSATIDTANKQAEVAVTLKGVQGTGDLTGTLRVVADIAYVQVSLLGPTWYSLPLSAASQLAPSTAPQASLDPGKVFGSLLTDPSVKITYVGTGQLNGRDQNEVAVLVPGKTLATWLSTAESMAGTSGVAGAVPLPSMGTVPDVTVNVWIDRQSGAFSKASTTLSDSGSTVTIGVTLKSHEGTVSIQAPPADQTQSAEQLLSTLMGGGSGTNPFGGLSGSPTP